jgi:hypothetical protein
MSGLGNGISADEHITCGSSHILSLGMEYFVWLMHLQHGAREWGPIKVPNIRGVPREGCSPLHRLARPIRLTAKCHSLHEAFALAHYPGPSQPIIAGGMLAKYYIGQCARQLTHKSETGFPCGTLQIRTSKSPIVRARKAQQQRR